MPALLGRPASSSVAWAFAVTSPEVSPPRTPQEGESGDAVELSTAQREQEHTSTSGRIHVAPQVACADCTTDRQRAG